ncbi:type II toxin-antitoxin system PemK/MazF family toxin [Galbitalea sp. SE-J8]|nr:type II toxin-antitoxin system PemK/MazF family toxin [Galbitalea sp. SE-J8]MDM4764268.1 type II toxin-antitoxin system PemK/MazF family toxin [Galbitalea sp. SE-J8]
MAWVDLGLPIDSAPAKRRPVLLISADPFNRSALSKVVVAVISSNTALAAHPGNVFLPAASTGLPKDSVVNVTQRPARPSRSSSPATTSTARARSDAAAATPTCTPSTSASSVASLRARASRTPRPSRSRPSPRGRHCSTSCASPPRAAAPCSSSGPRAASARS